MEGFYFHRKIFNQTRLKKFYQKRSSCENFLSIKNPVAIVRKPPWLKHLFSKMASVEYISGILLKKGLHQQLQQSIGCSLGCNWKWRVECRCWCRCWCGSQYQCWCWNADAEISRLLRKIQHFVTIIIYN